MPDQLRDRLRSPLGDADVLERELGGGGMARAFPATDPALAAPVGRPGAPSGRPGSS